MSKFYFLVLFFIFACGCTERTELGSKKNPIQISLTPGKDIVLLKNSGEKLKEYLEDKLDLYFEVHVPPSYVAVVETFGTKRTDLAILNTMGYLIAHEKYGAEAIFILTNQGRDQYRGQIIARVSGPKNLKDLNGKKFAFVDPISASGHLLPAQLFKKNNIQLKEYVFAGRHDSVVSMVYQGQVDAGATFWAPDENEEPFDARKLVMTQYPDIYKKVRVIAYTEFLPNEALVVRKDFPQDLRKKIIHSLISWSSSDDGKKTLKDLYNNDGLKQATDADYEPARKVLKDLNKKVQDLSI